MPNPFLQDLAKVPQQIEEVGGRFRGFLEKPRPTLEERLAEILEKMRAKQVEAEATRAPRFLGVEDQRFVNQMEPDEAIAGRAVSPTVAPANVTPEEREAILARSRVPTPTPAPGELGGPAKIGKTGPIYIKSAGKTYLVKDGERIDVTPPKKITSFGVGEDAAYIRPELFDEIMKIEDEDARMAIAELAGQESSYGYAKPHITEKEESYGPYHINLLAGRISPRTGKAFTREEAEDVELATKYALSEYERTGGLGSWNPGAYDFYQTDLPERAKTKKFIRGK